MIRGTFYTSQELQELLGEKRSTIFNRATRKGWKSPAPGLYWAEDWETYLVSRGINTVTVRTYHNPEGKA